MEDEVNLFWEKAAKGRNEEAYGCADSMNSVRLRLTLDILDKYKPGKLLDAGCGAGATTTAVLDLGWDAVAIDYAQNMVDETNAHLRSEGYSDNLACRASVTNLERFPDNFFDAVICLGVMYYIEQDDLAYRELWRVLKPDALFICSHQNEFFDLFTLNRYTVRFFRRHFFPLIDGGQGERAKELDAAICSLLAYPNEPELHDRGSARDSVFTRQENPLNFPAKLAKYGFQVECGPYYHGVHLAPPLIEKRMDNLRMESQEKQYALAQDWRAMFLAAHFLYEARKLGNS